MPADSTTNPPDFRPLGEALRRLGPSRNGRPVHVATGTRWILSGVPLSDGSRLYLRAKRLPGRWVVTDEAIDEFVDALTRDRTSQQVKAPTRTVEVRTRAAERAEAELVRAGF